MPEKATVIKIGKSEHIDQLQKEGLIYMNNLPFFWRIEDGKLRGDPADSVEKIFRGNEGKMIIDNTEIQINSWSLRQHPLNPEKINIFCMYAARPSFDTYPIDEKNYEFGDTALVFINPQEFFNRLFEHLEKNKIAFKADLVSYYEKDYAGEIGPFKKDSLFAYQSEWRLVCYNNSSNNARILKIGNLEDISKVVKVEEINSIEFL